MILGALFIVPGLWLVFNQGWVVRVKQYTEDTATLLFVDAAYAEQFRRLNQTAAVRR